MLLRLPDVPVMVMVEVPVAAEALALKVSVFPLKDAVTPAGRPDAARATVPLNPFCGVTVIVLVPAAPCTAVTLAGDAASVKPGAAVTVRLIVVLLLRLPDVPVMVMVDAPVAAEALGLSVSVLPLKDAVTPAGRPEAARETVPLNPPAGVTVMVLVPVAPCTTVTLAGAAARVKDGVPLTVSLIVAVLLRLPDVPVMVIV